MSLLFQTISQSPEALWLETTRQSSTDSIPDNYNGSTKRKSGLKANIISILFKIRFITSNETPEIGH